MIDLGFWYVCMTVNVYNDELWTLKLIVVLVLYKFVGFGQKLVRVLTVKISDLQGVFWINVYTHLKDLISMIE